MQRRVSATAVPISRDRIRTGRRPRISIEFCEGLSHTPVSSVHPTRVTRCQRRAQQARLMSDPRAILLRMGELAYMIRADWAQQATAMVPQSEVIRSWVGSAPYMFAVPDLARYNKSDRNLEREVADYIAPQGTKRSVHSVANFGELRNTDTVVERCVIAVHPEGARTSRRSMSSSTTANSRNSSSSSGGTPMRCALGSMRTVRSICTPEKPHQRPTRSWWRQPA